MMRTTPKSHFNLRNLSLAAAAGTALLFASCAPTIAHNPHHPGSHGPGVVRIPTPQPYPWNPGNVKKPFPRPNPGSGWTKPGGLKHPGLQPKSPWNKGTVKLPTPRTRLPIGGGKITKVPKNTFKPVLLRP